MWFCVVVCHMCWVARCIKVVSHTRVCVFAGPRAEWQAASGMSAMALALDAATLNAIAANWAVAFRSWIHEKLGRSDVVVSCVCPLLHACVSGDCASFACFNGFMGVVVKRPYVVVMCCRRGSLGPGLVCEHCAWLFFLGGSNGRPCSATCPVRELPSTYVISFVPGHLFNGVNVSNSLLVCQHQSAWYG